MKSLSMRRGQRRGTDGVTTGFSKAKVCQLKAQSKEMHLLSMERNIFEPCLGGDEITTD